jgi:hypothetical protein
MHKSFLLEGLEFVLGGPYHILQSALRLSFVLCVLSLTILMICLNLPQISSWSNDMRPQVDELSCARVSYALIHDALACGDHGTLMPQSRQCDRDLLGIAAAHAVCNDVDLVPSPEKIDGGLCDANVALDADDDARERTGDFEAVERFLDFRGSGML